MSDERIDSLRKCYACGERSWRQDELTRWVCPNCLAAYPETCGGPPCTSCEEVSATIEITCPCGDEVGRFCADCAPVMQTLCADCANQEADREERRLDSLSAYADHLIDSVRDGDMSEGQARGAYRSAVRGGR